MSARAAARLEAAGFSEVYDYADGKTDWLARGLPSEGETAGIPRAKDAIVREVPTCHPGHLVGEVRPDVPEDRRNSCVVLDEKGVVLGRLRREHYDAPDGTPVEEVMETGPVTFRASVPLDELVQRMQQRKVGSVIVTTPDGEFLGVLFRRRAERLLHERGHV